jgi:hypothetical protein
MPTVLRIGPYRFFFYADERQEPPHIHVVAAGKEAKYWLVPVSQAWSREFRSGESKEIESIIGANLNLFLEAWNDFFNGR